MIKYLKKDLFTAPRGSIILHATNCKGVWGNGIAKTFAQKYPKAFREYKMECDKKGETLAGKTLLIPTVNYTIGCLFTSRRYGIFKDNTHTILENTAKAVVDLITQLNNQAKTNVYEFHLPKINSGLFAVPWPETERLLKQLDDAATNQGYKITWNVYTK